MMAQDSSRRGAKVLEQLPHVFHVSDLVATGCADASARVALWRWEARTLVRAIGAHSGLYVNHKKSGEVPVWAAALVRLYPEARVVGELALHLGGWLAQAPAHVEIAIHPKRVPPTFDEVSYTYRGRLWVKNTRPSAEVYHGVAVLSPESAWCDILAFDPRKAVRLQGAGLRIPEGVSIEQLRREAMALERAAPLPGTSERRKRRSRSA